MDLQFQVPMQYCSLQHWTLFLSPITSTAGYCLLLWLHPFIISGFISPLISSSILGTYQACEFLFQYPITLPFHTVHGVLKARILKWFAIPFSSGPHSVSWLWLTGVHSGADCGSDHEFLIAKFRIKLKKVERTTRGFRYYLNQIANSYIVEVTNRFKELDLIDRVPEELWTEVRDIVEETGIKNIPKKKEMQKVKMNVWGGFTNSWGEKRSERQKRKGKIYPFECRVPRIARRDKKAFLSDQCKEIEENNRMGKTRDLFKKIRGTKGKFHAKMGSVKDRYVPNRNRRY